MGFNPATVKGNNTSQFLGYNGDISLHAIEIQLHNKQVLKYDRYWSMMIMVNHLSMSDDQWWLWWTICLCLKIGACHDFCWPAVAKTGCWGAKSQGTAEAAEAADVLLSCSVFFLSDRFHVMADGGGDDDYCYYCYYHYSYHYHVHY